jgi:lipoprotein-anchoring transpeptidase ErfK/SrfK
LFEARLPLKIPRPGEKIIIVNPRIHSWGAYSSEGNLLRTGLATAGAKWCADVKRACRTKVGVFRIFSLGEANCKSTRYPLGKGGAPMPYCMYFNNNQGLHGSHEVVEDNISHGCVRLNINDAKWIRYQFANIGTKVIILSY